MYRNPLVHTILEVYSFRTLPYSLELYLYDVHFYIYACKCEIYVQFRNKYRLIDEQRDFMIIMCEHKKCQSFTTTIFSGLHFKPEWLIMCPKNWNFAWNNKPLVKLLVQYNWC